MAADSNMGFHFDTILESALNRHSISFQSGAINSTSGLVQVGNSVGMNSTTGIVMAGNSSSINTTPGIITPAGTSTSSLLLDSVPALRHDTELAVDWSVEEQSKLEDGLVKYANEASIMKYIKIAATLPEKTVRDVALRCRWMTEKVVASASNSSIPSAAPPNMVPYPLMVHRMDHTDRLLREEVGGTIRHLLDENAQVFSDITANLATFKIQDNINLFCRTRNNITAILNDMRDIPGIMSQMPPLPVSINEELASAILPNTAQVMFGSPSRLYHLKQEPRC